MEIKEIRNLFTFRMTDEVFNVVKSEVFHLSEVYEPLREFTIDDVKAAYKANAEDGDFINMVVEKIPAIRAKGVLISDEIATRLTLKWIFIQQMTVIISKLRKLADKLETATTIALSEGYSLSNIVHEAVGSAAKQNVEGALTIYNDIAETKTRAIRAADTRKKNDAAKKKAEKLATTAWYSLEIWSTNEVLVYVLMA